MKVYLVGGAVRDIIMGNSPKDYDFVVVGSSVEEMLSKGYTQVGKDFPVFHHPITKDEYALARVERKVGVGYKGFECDWEGVTLEEDLFRRDLTMNSIALEVDVISSETLGEIVTVGTYIDPFNGVKDIKDRIIRPTSKHFSEDPVRALRVGRFLARYPDFRPSWRLVNKIISMNKIGSFSSLVPDRVWKEMSRALSEKEPSYFFDFLLLTNAPFMEVFKEMSNTVEDNPYHQEADVFLHTYMVLDHASSTWNDPEINFACLLHDIAKPKCYQERGNAHGHDGEGVSMIEEWCTQWKVPNSYKTLAKITCEHHQKIHSVFGRGSNSFVKPKTIMKMFESTSAFSKPERFVKMLKACESDSKGRIGIGADKEYLQRVYLEECLSEVVALDTKAISSKLLSEGKSGVIIGEVIRQERIKCIRVVQNKWKEKLNDQVK